MFSALLAGALIVVASLLLGSAVMAIAGLPRHSPVGPAAGISALLVICGIAVKLPGHAVTAAVAVGVALIGCFVVFGRTRAPAGSGADRGDRHRDRRRSRRGDPVRHERPGGDPRPGARQRRHGLAPALHRVDQLARRPDPRPDQERLSARPARDRRRDGQGERRQPDRGLRRPHRRDRGPPLADGVRRARRESGLAARAGGGAGGEPLSGRRLPGPGGIQGAASRAWHCWVLRSRLPHLRAVWSLAGDTDGYRGRVPAGYQWVPIASKGRRSPSG